MDRFYDILREELELALKDGGVYANKERMMQTFDKCFTKAVIKYGRELNINLV